MNGYHRNYKVKGIIHSETRLVGRDDDSPVFPVKSSLSVGLGTGDSRL